MAAAGASRALTLLAALVVIICSTMMGSSNAYDFYVGGRQGWVQKPSESYNAWAGRNRFQVNDRLVFRYKKREDSVLVVTEPAYRACDTSNPIKRLDGGAGDSVFQFDRPGPFYFVSGVPERCRAGQKLVVVVLSPRDGRRPRPAAPPCPAAGPSPLPPPPAGLPPPPALQPPPATGPGGAGPSAPPSELPRGPPPPSGSSSVSSPLATAVAALALAGATFVFV